MYDLRLTWLKYLVGPHGLILVYPSNINSPAVSTIAKYFNNKNNNNRRLISINYSGNRFIPLSKDKLLKTGQVNIIYLLNSKESGKSLKRKLQIANQKMIAEYTVLSGWLNPRWCVPKGRKYSPGKITKMINPSSFKARVGFALFGALWLLKLDHLIFTSRIILANKDNNTKNRLEDNLFYQEDIEKINHIVGENIRQGIVYAGSFGPLQKFTIELLGKNGLPVAYVKIGHDYLTNKAIQLENSVLTDLAKIHFESIKVPESKLINHFYDGQDKALIQKKLERGVPLKRITPPVVQSLVELYQATRLPELLPLEIYINELIVKYERESKITYIDKYKPVYKNVIDTLVVTGHNFSKNKIPICLSHGDFTRWNVRIDGKTLSIFDWEEARMRPPGHDLLTFLFVEELLVRHVNKARIAEKFVQIALGKGNNNCQDYFQKISPKTFKSPIVYVLLFIAEITNYYLWHAKEHKIRNFPEKQHIDYVLNTAEEILREIKRVAK